MLARVCPYPQFAPALEKLSNPSSCRTLSRARGPCGLLNYCVLSEVVRTPSCLLDRVGGRRPQPGLPGPPRFDSQPQVSPGCVGLFVRTQYAGLRKGTGGRIPTLLALARSALAHADQQPGSLPPRRWVPGVQPSPPPLLPGSKPETLRAPKGAAWSEQGAGGTCLCPPAAPRLALASPAPCPALTARSCGAARGPWDLSVSLLPLWVPQGLGSFIRYTWGQ